MNNKKYKITLGPCLFNWKVNDWRDFYFSMADNPNIDEVYIGEVVCIKRFPFFEVAFEEVITRLQKAGKIVNLSSFSLLLSKLEVNANKEMLNKFSNLNMEANDIGLLNILSNKKHIVGPTINVYNEFTAQTLAKKGAYRICFPYEIDKDSLNIISNSIPNIEKEIFAFGRMPLAIAARCYHSRIHNTTKEDCRYVCEKDYNAKPIKTTTGEDFLSINGTQTMSFSYNNLITELHNLLSMGINIFRISPHYMDIHTIINLFKSVLEKTIDPKEALSKMENILPLHSKFSNGFFYGEAGRNMMKNTE